MITFKETLVKWDSDGALSVRYTPVIETGPCVTGELSFAFYEAAVGDPPWSHEVAKHEAKANACAVLLRILRQEGFAVAVLKNPSDEK